MAESYVCPIVSVWNGGGGGGGVPYLHYHRDVVRFMEKGKDFCLCICLLLSVVRSRESSKNTAYADIRRFLPAVCLFCGKLMQ